MPQSGQVEDRLGVLPPLGAPGETCSEGSIVDLGQELVDEGMNTRVVQLGITPRGRGGRHVLGVAEQRLDVVRGDVLVRIIHSDRPSAW